jgi:hypothetical protein
MWLQGFIASCNPNNLREVNRRRNFEVSSFRKNALAKLVLDWFDGLQAP